MTNEELVALGKRIEGRRKSLKMTMAELGSRIGVAASTIQRYEAGKISRPKYAVLCAMASAMAVSVKELTGETQATAASIKIPQNATPLDVSSMVNIPIIGKVAAGLSCYAEDYLEGYELEASEMIRSGFDYVYLRVRGDSMQPLIIENDLVLVRCQDVVENGDYGIVIIDGEDGVVKRIYMYRDKVELISENPYYPPRVFEGEECERVKIFGKVVEVKRKL
ncbi:MAG: XRE family transcriptional regulator [Oscillospiraceae bacterium]|nr:XRE family transcriptional regulator [Oscillospiraceae bacterium]